MKKSMFASTVTIILLGSVAYAQELVSVGTDGYSTVYVPNEFQRNPAEISNDAGCYVGTVLIPSHVSGSFDKERIANQNLAMDQALLQQQNEAAQKAVCPIVTLNGVTIQVNNKNRYEMFPLSFSGWIFDFSKSANTDFLKRIEKISQTAKIDKNVLFLKWFIDRSTVDVASDSTGEYIVDNQQLNMGGLAITGAYWLQKLAMDGDRRFEELTKAFERDVMKGWTPDQKTKSLTERLRSQASWFECRQAGQKIKAVADVSTEQILKHVRSQRIDKQRLYLSLRIHEGKNKLITRNDRINGFPIDERYFNDQVEKKYDYKTDKWIAQERSLAWNYYTIVPHDPTLLWIADRTFADDPAHCEQLVPVEKAEYFVNPNKISTQDAPAGEWVSNPSNGCASVMEIGRVAHLENQNFGYKKMNVVRGENIASRGIAAFGDGLSPKVFYAIDNDVCHQLKNDGGLKVGKWFFPNRTPESEKADMEQRNNEFVDKYFPTGLWISNTDGTCIEADKNDLVAAAIKLNEIEKKAKDSIDVCNQSIDLGGKYASSKQIISEISGAKIFAGALAAVATSGVSLFASDKNSFKDENGFNFRDCAKAIRNDLEGDGVAITKRDLTFVAPSKLQCEAIAQAHKSLGEDDFKEKYLREIIKVGKR